MDWTSMPETTVYKYRNFSFSKYDVRPASKFGMKSITHSQCP